MSPACFFNMLNLAKCACHLQTEVPRLECEKIHFPLLLEQLLLYLIASNGRQRAAYCVGLRVHCQPRFKTATAAAPQFTLQSSTEAESVSLPTRKGKRKRCALCDHENPNKSSTACSNCRKTVASILMLA